MTLNLDIVKTEHPPGRPYHHGSLRPALIAAAEEILAERGVEGFSLREAARRAGVSPSAPAHHFGDARGLLTAVAAAAFGALADALGAADVPTTRPRVQRIKSQGIAYVGFALRRPASFDLMFRAALLNRDDPELRAEGRRAFRVLDRAARGEDAPECGPGDPVLAPAVAAWSVVHGFARLAIDGGFGMTPGAAERAAEALLPLVMDHLTYERVID